MLTGWRAAVDLDAAFEIDRYAIRRGVPMPSLHAIVALASLATPPSTVPMAGSLPPRVESHVSTPPVTDSIGVSSVQFERGGWTWVPTLRAGRVESFVGLRSEVATGENLATVWFRRKADGSWESLSWEDHDQARAIATVKATLGLSDSTDEAWPVAPATVSAGEPARLVGGVLESDAFAPFIEGLTQQAELVQSLEAAGWKAAWIDAWAEPCGQDAVLEAWAAATEIAGAGTAEHGDRPEGVAMMLAKTVSKPCGGATCQPLYVDARGAVVLFEESPGSVLTSGVVADATGAKWHIQNDRVPVGAVATSALFRNLGGTVATILVGGQTVVEVAPGSSVAVKDTLSPCEAQCATILRQSVKESIAYYCVDPKCHCCCWAGLQPKPPEWLNTLANCPCSLKPRPRGGFYNPDPDVWDDPSSASQTYHPGAAYCIRESGVAEDVTGRKAGQQCCYDAKGILITVGAGAGTPDLYSPVGISDIIDHYGEDVVSWERCSEAGMLDCYLRHRPPNNDRRCPCNPPAHAHCTAPPTDASCDCDESAKGGDEAMPVR